MAMNWFERTLLALAPRVALDRMRVQMAARELSRKYDGASTGRRTSGWRSSNSSANAETAVTVDKLRNHARDVERNNAWGGKALSVLSANVIGTGIRAQAKGPNKKQTKRAMDLWAAWAETTACDWDNSLDFYGLQALAFRTAARDGEALIRLRRVAGGPVPLKLQLLEADFLDTYRLTGDNGNTVIQGVEVDSEGRAVAYWLWSRHPGDSNTAIITKSYGLESTRIPADQIIRLYRKDRPGQLRGVSWLAPIMLPLRDLDDYEDAQLIRQKIAACFSVFIHDSAGADALTDVSDEADLPEKVEPGIIEILPPGKAISFAAPPEVDGYPDYIRTVLQKVAAGIGVTYEALTGDLTSTNFSSGRMGWIEMGRNLEAWRWQMVISQLCAPVWAAFIQAASIAGPSIEGVGAEWTPPRRELIDPAKEIAAKQSAVRNGFKSWSEAVREEGYDPQALAEEMAEDVKRFRALGLVLDCDPSQNTQQGQARQPGSEELE